MGFAVPAGRRLGGALTVRVLYSFPHTLGAPGIGTTALHQVRGLRGLGIDVRLYCTSIPGTLPDRLDGRETLALRGRRIPHRLLGVQRAYAHHDRRVARDLRHLAGSVDLVHCWPGACLETLKAAEDLGIAALREVPNTHTERAYELVGAEVEALGIDLPRGHSHAFDAGRLAREKAEYGAASLLLVPSAYVEQTFLERGFPPARLARHQYGFDPDSFPHPGPPAEARSDRDLQMVFVGRCEPRKGLHHALTAWTSSPAAARGRFVICGNFVPGYREYLEPLLRHPGVEVRGFVDDVGAVLRAADVLVLPSVEEGSALITYEAQASGCALLVSDAAGARCQHMVEGLIHPAGDAGALREHIDLLDRDRALLDRLRAGALARRDDLTWSAAARRLVDIYRAAVPVG